VLASCIHPVRAAAGAGRLAGAPTGTYWDGGITDYHLHLRYAALPDDGLVLYPHFHPTSCPAGSTRPGVRRHAPPPACSTTLVLLAPAAGVGGTLPRRQAARPPRFSAPAATILRSARRHRRRRAAAPRASAWLDELHEAVSRPAGLRTPSRCPDAERLR
jgi:hypothetical protein